MPQVLDYASPRKRERKPRVDDFPVTSLAIIQVAYLVISFNGARAQEMIGTFQRSLFAGAWQFTQNDFGVLTFNLAISILLLSAAVRPVAQRKRRYQAYLVAVLFYALIFSVAHWYLQTQLPGPWGSALLPSQSASFLRSALGSYPPGLVLLCIHPAFWVLQFRSLFPRLTMVGR